MNILHRPAREGIPQTASFREVRGLWGRTFQEEGRANAKVLVGKRVLISPDCGQRGAGEGSARG